MKKEITLPEDWGKWFAEHEQERKIFDEIILPLIRPAFTQFRRNVEECKHQLNSYIKENNIDGSLTLNDLLDFIATFNESEKQDQDRWGSDSFIISTLQVLMLEQIIADNN